MGAVTKIGKPETVGLTSGWRSNVAVGIVTLVMVGWVGWPLLASANAPTAENLASESPYILVGVTGCAALVGALLWVDVKRHLDAVSPILALIAVGVIIQVTFGTDATPINWWVALVSGALLGPAGGWLTGAGICLVLGLIGTGFAATTVAVMLAMCGFGLLGAALHRAQNWVVIMAGGLATIPFGVLASMITEIGVWSSRTDLSDPTTYLAGLEPAKTFQRLWDSITQTAVGGYLAIAMINAVLLASLGWWLLANLRASYWLEPKLRLHLVSVSEPSTLDPSAVDRRNKSDQLANLWSDKESKNDPRI